MGKGIGKKRHENCWTYRSGFEKALIISTLLPFVIVVVLVTFLLFQLNLPGASPNSCNNPICQQEAAQLSLRLDPSSNPCQDFYQFSCGALWKNKNKTADPFSSIIDESKQKVFQLYNEPIRINDHRIVKAAKILYRTCLNATAIRDGALSHLNKTLQKLGGWPVLQGTQWNGSQFSWLNVTLLLRQHGLFHGSFIDILIVPDTNFKNRFILKVAIPEAHQMQVRDVNDFVEIATALGAEENSTIEDYEEMYKLVESLRRELFLRYNDEPPTNYTIKAFQNKTNLINWKDFLNNVLGSTILIKEDDQILFDSPNSLHQWISFITKIPKRNQANYMIWKALEHLLPYLQNTPDISENDRTDFCVALIRDRFSPSPLDVTYVQKYLPESKRTLAQDLVNNIKLEVLNLLERNDWLDAADREKATKRLVNMKQIIGAPEEYLNRDAFYEMDVDMNEFDENDDNFISNLLKVQKNYQTRIYQQISKGQMLKWSLQTGSLIGDYYWEDNIMNIPATVLQGSIFNEARPKYANYGSIGMLLSHHFFRILTGERTKIFDVEMDTGGSVHLKLEEKLRKCLSIQLNNTYLIDVILQQSLGFQTSYGAYKKSVHSKEDLGFGGYTASQLYWLSAASYFCQSDLDFSNMVENKTEPNLFSRLFLSSIANNKNFGEDFNCALEGKTHPKEKCTIF